MSQCLVMYRCEERVASEERKVPMYSFVSCEKLEVKETA